jgi:UDP-2-acetamido-3-amino-2,3-dideoxy-glucuronate N-acetyltransferase
MPKVGLAGAGYWGKNILRVLKELGLLYSVCDTDAKNRNLLSYKDIRIHKEYDKFLSDKNMEAVVISTPAGMHYDMARHALEAGKDVFVEKPLSLNIDEGIALAEKAKELGRILMVGHILQYHPAVLKLKEIISKGILGKVQYIYSNRLNIGKLRTEENILWSFAPHDISVMLMIAGSPPVRITAFAGDYLTHGVYDTSLTAFEFRNNIKGHIFVSWLHPFKEQKLVVVGSNAMAVFDDVSSEKLKLYKHVIEWKDGSAPVAHKAPFEVIATETEEPLKLELMHFKECIMNRTKPRTDGNEGVEVLKVLHECENQLSMRKESANRR